MPTTFDGDLYHDLVSDWKVCVAMFYSQYTHTDILHLVSVVSEDQLNLVLVKLVEYLGHASIITSATAFTEVSSVFFSYRRRTLTLSR